MALKNKFSKAELKVESSVQDPSTETTKEEPEIEPVVEEINEEEIPEPEDKDPEFPIDIEIEGSWVNCEKAKFGVPITGIKSDKFDIRVKTSNGWFDESDPDKAPIIMFNLSDAAIKARVHVLGGEWLALSEGDIGCNVPMDFVSFVKA